MQIDPNPTHFFNTSQDFLTHDGPIYIMDGVMRVMCGLGQILPPLGA